MDGGPKLFDVLCLGILVADTFAKPIKRFPDWGTLEVIDYVDMQPGGCPVNTATGLARLGFRTGVIGKVGQDDFGDFVVQRVASKGVNMRGVRRDAKAGTSFTFVMIAPDGERAFYHYVGANGTLMLDDIDFDWIAQAKILDIGGSFVLPGIDGEPTAEILRRARAAGLITTLDTVWNGEIDQYATIKPSLPHLDYFLPSLGEAQLIAKLNSPADISQFFLDHGVKAVGLKMGLGGCYIRTRDVELKIPAYAVNTVDNTGAGDAWRAGFLAGILQRWDLERTGQFANAVGALCVTAIGCTAGIRNLAETLRFMETAQPRHD
jgi:sugar/nucleoside kinase (ribokinase family)